MRRNKSAARVSARAKPVIQRPSGTRHVPKERPGNRMTEDRRQEIVRKAAALFIEKGYSNVTIDEIIRLVGGSKATLYARFGGKEGLFETVIKQPCVDVTHALDIDPAGDVKTQLTQIARTFLRSVLNPNILELHRLMVSIGKTFPAVGSFFMNRDLIRPIRSSRNGLRNSRRPAGLLAETPASLRSYFLTC